VLGAYSKVNVIAMLTIDLSDISAFS